MTLIFGRRRKGMSFRGVTQCNMKTMSIQPVKAATNAQYYLAAIVAFAGWGFFSLVLKPLHLYAAADILFYRVFSCAVLLLILTAVFRRKVLLANIDLFKVMPAKERRRSVWLNVAGGLLLTVNWYSFIYVMNHVSVKATSLAYLICPIITTLLARFILREPLTRQQLLAIAMSIAGCILLSYSDPLQMVCGFVIGLSFAFYLVSQRTNQAFDKMLMLTFQILISSLALLPFYFAYSSPLPTSMPFYGYIELIAVAFTIVPLFLNLYALKGINSSTLGMLLNINPIIAFMLSIFVYHEQTDTLQYMAFLIIFLSLILFNAGALRTGNSR